MYAENVDQILDEILELAAIYDLFKLDILPLREFVWNLSMSFWGPY